VGVLRNTASTGDSPTKRQYAVTAIDMLVAGPMMRHIATHLPTIDEANFERVQAMCLSLGEVVVKPLAEALSTEERARPRQRLTSILLAFGVVGKRTAERLKGSQNPAVRRTAIYLLREFGGSDALPELTELLDDTEPQVQREAVRAILNIGTEQAYEVLEKALLSGTDRSREAIMQAVIGLRDERAAPLFTYIVRHVSHRGPLAEVYLRAIESLGVLADPEAVAPLKEALYRGEWWAPGRNKVLRGAAAHALARIGTPDAQAVLDEAIASGPRGVRAAAKAHLHTPRARARDRGERR
jgi:HEAT repeat protein